MANKIEWDGYAMLNPNADGSFDWVYPKHKPVPMNVKHSTRCSRTTEDLPQYVMLIALMQGIESKRSGFEFVIRGAGNIRVYYRGDFMGYIAMSAPSNNTDRALVIQSRNVDSKPRGNLTDRQTFTRNVESAITTALNVFVPMSTLQRYNEVVRSAYSRIESGEGSNLDMSAELNNSDRFVYAQVGTIPDYTKMVFLISKLLQSHEQEANTELSWDERIEDASVERWTSALKAEFAKFNKMELINRHEHATWVVGVKRMAGVHGYYVQENRGKEIYVWNKADDPSTGTWARYPRGLDDPLLPNFIREGMLTTATIGPATYVKGVGMCVSDGDDYSHGRLFYIEPEIASA